MLPNLNDIFTKKVKQFRGQTKNFDMSFYEPRILNNSLIIPDYQRGDVWTLEQKQDLIRSMYYGISIPPVILNQRETKDANDEGQFLYYVVDGGQRLRTIGSFIKGELVVDGFNFNTMPDVFQKLFLYCMVPAIITSFKDEEEEKMYYRLFNTNATPHTKEDIKKAL